MEKERKALVSIIVPIYNTEKYLRRCIESMLAQTYENLEIILVDDASTDCSAEICMEYERRDARVRFLTLEKNQGVSVARNMGISNAKGDYIAFLDSDDWMHEDMLNKLVLASEKNNADMVMCGYQSADSDGNLLKKYPLKDIEEVTETMIFQMWCKGQMECFPSSKLYKRHIFDKAKFPKDKKYEDAFIFTDTLEASKKITMISDELLTYRIHNASFTKSEFRIEHMDVIEAFLKIYNYAVKKKMDFLIKEMQLLIYRRLITVIKKFALGGKQQTRVRELMQEVVKTCGWHVKYTPMIYLYYWMRVLHMPILRKE